jgi:hypothetical protein
MLPRAPNMKGYSSQNNLNYDETSPLPVTYLGSLNNAKTKSHGLLCLCLNPALLVSKFAIG